MMTTETSRRNFLKTTSLATGGLLMGVALPGAKLEAMAAGMVHTPNAWVHIADNNTITLISARSEMGQGVYTSMPMLIAEELNVDIRKIKVSIAPPNAKLYGNPLLGGPQLTGGSTSVRDGWEKLRVAGAQVREMLISAAAAKWKVDPSELKAENGMVFGPKGKKATYGQLAEAASKLPVPIYTPAAKAAVGDHDENITFEKTVEMIGLELATQIRDLSIRIYKAAAEIALQKGIIIADTKFEFGLDKDGTLTLMDEVLTPDSSRFWPQESYQEGTNPPSYDKQFVRDWLEQAQVDGRPWSKTPPAPRVPDAVITKTAAKYQEALTRLTT